MDILLREKGRIPESTTMGTIIINNNSVLLL